MPGIGFFAPLPLAVMIPFMATQSAAMAHAFGTFFQYGKRKISAMDNDEFNKLTPEKLSSVLSNDINRMIPALENQLDEMRGFQSAIIKELIAYVKQFPQDVAAGIGGPAGQNLQSNYEGATGIVDQLLTGIQDMLPNVQTAYADTGSTQTDLPVIKEIINEHSNKVTTVESVVDRLINIVDDHKYDFQWLQNEKHFIKTGRKQYNGIGPKNKNKLYARINLWLKELEKERIQDNLKKGYSRTKDTINEVIQSNKSSTQIIHEDEEKAFDRSVISLLATYNRYKEALAASRQVHYVDQSTYYLKNGKRIPKHTYKSVIKGLETKMSSAKKAYYNFLQKMRGNARNHLIRAKANKMYLKRNI